MVAPIISNDRVIGVFDLESDRLNAYTEDDLEILQSADSQVAIIIEKVRLHEEVVEKKRIQAQLDIARQVQLELLPASDPDVEGFDISAYIFPDRGCLGRLLRLGPDLRGPDRDRCRGRGRKGNSGGAADGVSAGVSAGRAFRPALPRTSLRKRQQSASRVDRGQSVHHGDLRHPGRDEPHVCLFERRPQSAAADQSRRRISLCRYGDMPLGMFDDLHYHQHFIRFEPAR